MKELFEKFLMHFCIAGLCMITVAAIARSAIPVVVQKTKGIGEMVRRNGVAAAIAVVAFVCAMVVYGSTKNNAQSNDSPAQTQIMVGPAVAGEARPAHIVGGIVRAGHEIGPDVIARGFPQQAGSPSSVPTNALVRVEKWWRRGALNDGHIVTFDGEWCFPYGTNHLESVEVWGSGAVYASEKEPTPIAELGTKLSLAPHDTEVYVGMTTNNSYRIEWHGGHPNRDPSQTADASIELFRNGNVVVTENDVAIEVPYEIPFEHDGFGQDDDWVRANFTNAEEIIAIGYANWVDQQVGVGLTNGLYKFTALFEDDPPEPTELYIGDYSVCVTNAGEYVFVLEKGEEYEFGTWPFNDDVDYWAQDDMAEGAPILRSMWGGWGSPGEWTIDGGWNWLALPYVYLGQYYRGYCFWRPTLQGTPDVLSHLRGADFPKLFSAVVSDYPNPDGLSYEWHSSDDNVMIMSPHSRETLVAVDSMLSWDFFDLSVSTQIKGLPYTSSVRVCYGTNETPVASLRMSAPKVVFVNDDGRTSRWYRVFAQLVSPTPTNTVLEISHSGGAQVRFATDPEGRNGLVLTNVNLSVDSPLSWAGYEFFFAATNNNCTGTFTAKCTLPDSTVLTASRGYKVIEPLRKLVCKEPVADGYYNPSRLVYGTNAWLKVGVNGQFTASEVQWRIVSGPGRIVSRNDAERAVCVEPTASSGEVVVEAAFGNDSLIQPRFVLPIVEKRIIPLRAFVTSANGLWAASPESISNRIAAANRIYTQVGVEFDLLSITTNNVGTATDMVVREYDYVTNANGRVRRTFARQALNLLNTYTSHDCIEVYFVRSITNGMATAFKHEKGLIFGEKATNETLAHELGHALGLKDCYVWRRLPSPNSLGQQYCFLTNYSSAVSSSLLTNRTRDWGRDDGRSFYETVDTTGQVGKTFIMYGVGERGNIRADIPNGRINCLRKDATDSAHVQESKIGADDIELNNERVFSK